MRHTTVLVEGESDRVAIETLAVRAGVDLWTVAATVVPMGGVTSIGRFLRHHGPAGVDDRLLGLCDARESAGVLRALDRAGVGTGPLAARGFQVCEADLEDELIRCLGPESVLDVLDAEGELGSFRLLQRQPAQRDRTLTQQLRRFLAGRSGHKITYARLLVEALPPGVTPPPLGRLVADLAQSCPRAASGAG